MFYIGQKVMAKCNQIQGRFKKGDKFVVLNISQCPCKCGFAVIDIGHKKDYHDFQYCSGCKSGVNNLTTSVIYDATDFVPIEESFQRMTFEKVIELVETCNN